MAMVETRQREPRGIEDFMKMPQDRLKSILSAHQNPRIDFRLNHEVFKDALLARRMQKITAYKVEATNIGWKIPKSSSKKARILEERMEYLEFLQKYQVDAICKMTTTTS